MSSQPPKDFLALSHGHEWVDSTSRSTSWSRTTCPARSELLRKAMSLPEVADREVAQVRDDLESRLTTERAQNQATLTRSSRRSQQPPAGGVAGTVGRLADGPARSAPTAMFRHRGGS